MPIESDIPLEIDRYEKKIVFGLTARQLIGLALALPLAAGAYFLFIHVLGLSSDIGGWLVMLAAAPPLAVGFIRIQEEPFERVLARALRRYLRPTLLCYTADPCPAPDGGAIKRKGGISHGAHPIPPGGENTYRFRPGQGRKRKRKQTARRIKAAEKEYRQAVRAARAAQRA